MSKKFAGFICLLAFISTCCSAYAYSQTGSTGNEVVKIQKTLNSLGYNSGAEDGIYGKITKEAVIEYQKDNNLNPDGICGTETLKSMKITSETDIELLARVINGEARGEDFEGQVAVGAVVLNRVNHPSFPDTIHDVVYQRGAFSAVKDGQIKKSVTESCKKAAIAALNGADPTNGAVFYYNPETATCSWIKTRTPVKKIGNHLFCI